MLRKGEGRDCPKSTFDTVKLERIYKLPGEMELWSLKRLVVQSRVAHGVIAVLADLIAAGDKHAATYEVLLKKLEREIKNPTTAVAIDAEYWTRRIDPHTIRARHQHGRQRPRRGALHRTSDLMNRTSHVPSAWRGNHLGLHDPKQNSPEQDLVRIQEVMQHAENTLDPIRWTS
jgi:hypothetical protein